MTFLKHYMNRPTPTTAELEPSGYLWVEWLDDDSEIRFACVLPDELGRLRKRVRVTHVETATKWMHSGWMLDQERAAARFT